jgi:hypothetical protein
MKKYIDKSALVVEIEKRLSLLENGTGDSEVMKRVEGVIKGYKSILSFLNTLEEKELDSWHLQEKENIYDAVKDWSLYTFACVMKDGTIQKFTGIMDEDYEGHINVHINGINDNYDNVDDIVKWIEFT